MSLRTIRVICAVACLALLIAIADLVFLALADGGYHAERYAGRFDPGRAAMLAIIAPGCLVVALLTWGTVASWRSERTRATFASAMSATGWFIMSIALVAVVIGYPNSAGGWVVPTPIAATLFTGVGLGIAGWLPEVLSDLFVAIRRRDRGLLIGLALVVSALAFVVLRRL